MPLLELKNVSVNYGSIRALKEINLTVDKGEIITLIEPTEQERTIMKTIMGLKRCDQGRLRFNGDNITNKDTRLLYINGLSCHLKDARYFLNLRLDNLLMGAYSRPDSQLRQVWDLSMTCFKTKGS